MRYKHKRIWENQWSTFEDHLNYIEYAMEKRKIPFSEAYGWHIEFGTPSEETFRRHIDILDAVVYAMIWSKPIAVRKKNIQLSELYNILSIIEKANESFSKVAFKYKDLETRKRLKQKYKKTKEGVAYYKENLPQIYQACLDQTK